MTSFLEKQTFLNVFVKIEMKPVEVIMSFKNLCSDPVRHGRAGVSRGTAHVCGGAQLERGLLWLQRLSPGLAAQRRRVRGCQRRPHLLLCSAPHVTSSLHRPSTYHLLPPPSLNLSANLSGPYRLRPSPLLTDCGLLLCSVCCAPPLHI